MSSLVLLFMHVAQARVPDNCTGQCSVHDVGKPPGVPSLLQFMVPATSKKSILASSPASSQYIPPPPAWTYRKLADCHCRDANGLVPNRYSQLSGHTEASCIAQCEEDSGCDAISFYTVGGPSEYASGCIVWGSTLTSAPQGWTYSNGSGGVVTRSEDCTRLQATGVYCMKKAQACITDSDCFETWFCGTDGYCALAWDIFDGWCTGADGGILKDAGSWMTTEADCLKSCKNENTCVAVTYDEDSNCRNHLSTAATGGDGWPRSTCYSRRLLEATPAPTQPPTDADPPKAGCCAWGNDCGDCGSDSSGWCHDSKDNCDACHGGTWRDSATPPTCQSDALQIKARHGICLDANQRSTDGGKVQMWSCDTNQPNQQWTYNDATGLISAKYGGCLDASERNINGGKVHMWSCHADQPNQQWEYNDATGEIKARYGLCLDASQRNTNGGKVHMWMCDPKELNQQWYVGRARTPAPTDTTPTPTTNSRPPPPVKALSGWFGLSIKSSTELDLLARENCIRIVADEPRFYWTAMSLKTGDDICQSEGLFCYEVIVEGCEIMGCEKYITERRAARCESAPKFCEPFTNGFCEKDDDCFTFRGNTTCVDNTCKCKNYPDECASRASSSFPFRNATICVKHGCIRGQKSPCKPIDDARVDPQASMNDMKFLVPASSR